MSNGFRKDYARLNKAQKLAVDTIDGPVMVIAGPGTGKTQLLSLRVANILSITDSAPENILCLTFSDSAANEMKQRLIKIIGPEAYKINVFTYHGFGSDLIRNNPAYFSDYANLKPITELASDTVIRSIQVDLPYSNPYKDSHFSLDIKKSISDFKQSLLSPEKLREIVEDNLAFIDIASKITKPLSQKLSRVNKNSIDDFNLLILPDKSVDKFSLLTNWNEDLKSSIEEAQTIGKNTPLSKWKLKYLAKNIDGDIIAAGREQNERLKHLINIYETYLKIVSDRSLYDYDDMILRSLDALTSNFDLKYSLQEEYQYLLLDEYQDTNPAQSKLVELLSDNPINEGRPNLMAVGDDDQAIYSFQGANYSQMLDFINRYKDVQLITLEENYRSSKDIIELSSKIADQIETRLGTMLDNKIIKQFKVGSSNQNNASLIKRYAFDTQPQEFHWIAKDIKLRQQDDLSIVVLSPKHKYLESIANYLQQLNVPISYERQENVLDDPIIIEIINLLRLVKAIGNKDNQRNIDALLAKVLSCDYWQLPTDTIWQVSWLAHKKKESWLNILLSESTTRNLILFILKVASGINELKFDYIIDQVLGLSEVKIINDKQQVYKSPFYDYYNSLDNSKLTSQIFSKLVAIRRQFNDFYLDNKEPLTISDFIDFIDQISLSNLKILTQESYSESFNAVKLMTAYKAKGQEFDVVYVISANDEVWGPSARSGSSRISYPPNLSFLSYRNNDIDEKIRLFYVALSRAKQQLHISSFNNNSTKSSISLRFLNEQPEDYTSPLLPESSKNIDSPLIETNQLNNWLFQDKQIEVKAELKELLKERLANYQLSPTELNSYLDVRNAGPENFFRRSILKYPSPVSPLVDYGSAVHESLDWLQRDLASTGRLATYQSFIDKFKNNLSLKQLNNKDFEQLLKRGQDNLKLYYENRKHLFNKDDISEANFKNEAVFIGDVHLTGNIDKLIINKQDKTITIVDYKTGKSYSKWASEAKLHLYQNQLYFYKLLVENSLTYKNYKVTSAYLDFIESDSGGQLQQLYIEFDQQQLLRFERLIIAVWNNIKSLNFPSVSSYPATLKGIVEFEDFLLNIKNR